MDPGRDHPARQRLIHDLLAWGGPRPRIPDGLAAALRAALESGLEGLGDELSRVAEAARGGRLVVGKTTLGRLVCDGWQQDPKPFTHTRASVRGTLTHLAIERDWSGDRHVPAGRVVDEVWRSEASRRPGDPSSLSAWLNRQVAAAGAELRDEVADLLDGYREVWPELPASAVCARVERPLEVPLGDGRVVLRGVPDLVLDSPVRDDQARSLVVDLKTGLPRPETDRGELRFYALLTTLSDDRPPFRWATFYVTEGRTEPEDLDPSVLEGVVSRVIDAVGQQLRLAAGPDGADLVIRPGSWCSRCAREQTCEAAARMRRVTPAGGVSHPDATV